MIATVAVAIRKNPERVSIVAEQRREKAISWRPGQALQHSLSKERHFVIAARLWTT